MIATREQLAHALTVAAELEHALLIQYLFAAYSLKKRPDPEERVSPAQADTCRLWERGILKIARDEMAHLGTVCNLLSAIGEAPHFLRPNFPQQIRPSSPFVFELSKFSEKTLYRFARAESPEKRLPRPAAVANQPDSILFEFTGELYRDIEQGFDRLIRDLGESRLFIGPQSSQDSSGWSNSFRIPLIRNGADAAAAIDDLITQGEGSPGNDEDSHFDMIEDIREDLAVEKEADSEFRPARWVVPNPRLNETLFGAGPGTLITESPTREIAHLFDSIYHTVLLMLMQYYSYGGETADQLGAIREAIRTSMSMALRPIAEILTMLPAAKDSPRTAGPCFEIAVEPRLSTQLANRWAILEERFSDHIAAADSILKTGGPAAIGRLAFIRQSLAGIAANVRNAAP